MPASPLDYSKLVERALRRVVHDALSLAAEQGLPGRHHFYVTFRTDHPGVVMDEALSARYPTEMTIVLQHEYWGLEVDDDGFAVTLSFGNLPQRLAVPYDAIRVFADPSVEFGLQFTVAGEAAAEGERPKASVAQLPAADEARPAPEPADQPEEGGEGGSAEVVTLDRFRKK
jgi:hypothetical protein